MNKAQQLNHCARHSKVEQQKTLEKNTYQWIEEVLMPHLQEAATKGYFSCTWHKLRNHASDTWTFESIKHPKGGLNIEIVTQELEKAGFHVSDGQFSANTYHISWEDKYVY